MNNDENLELERLDPESEACFQALAARIAEELTARIAIGTTQHHPLDVKSCQGLSQICP